jgi:hypothetical protein
VRTGKLRHVKIGCRTHVPNGAWEAFLQENTVTVCPDATKGHDCGGSPNADASTSHGPNTALDWHGKPRHGHLTLLRKQYEQQGNFHKRNRPDGESGR